VLTVGLTGGIGAGKSEVTRLLGALGAVVIDADQLAREVVRPGTPGLAAVVAEFGDQVLTPGGELDRPALASIVFADQGRRAALEAILHPLIRERSADLAARAPQDAVVVQDVPLLAEKDLADQFDLVLVVDASPRTQLERLVRLRGMTEADARARIAAQADRADRLALADHVIRNDGGRDALARRVRELWPLLRAAAQATGPATTR
jgi:dephospho-CoA kinase